MKTNKGVLILWYVFAYNIFTNMFRSAIRPSSWWCLRYRNTNVVKCVRITPRN